jgi:hypothetical protein
VTELVSPGGTLLVVSHRPGAERATTAVTAGDLRALLPGFEVVREVPTMLASAESNLFELSRI